MSSIRVMLNYLHCLNIPSRELRADTINLDGWMNSRTSLQKNACVFIYSVASLLHYKYSCLVDFNVIHPRDVKLSKFV